MIIKVKDGYRVVSESKDKNGKRKNLGTSKTREEAVKRLGQVEWFKHHK